MEYLDIKTSPLKFSVCVVTYNQEKYIEQCLQSLVDQVTAFDYEIIVGDDCSTDSTRTIIENLYKKYPEKIKPIYHKNNIGATENYRIVHLAASGKYVAHMDGDDYALPGKLQKQFNALESNPECVICTHDVAVVDKNSKILSTSLKKYKTGEYKLLDLLNDLPFFAHSSKACKKIVDIASIENIRGHTVDFEVHVEQAKFGNIFHINEALGSYRIMTGVSSQFKGVNPIFPEAAKRLFTKLLAERNKTIPKSHINKFYAKSFMKYSYQALVMGNPDQFTSYIRESVKIRLFSATQLLMYIFALTPKLAIRISKIRVKIKNLS